MDPLTLAIWSYEGLMHLLRVGTIAAGVAAGPVPLDVPEPVTTQQAVPLEPDGYAPVLLSEAEPDEYAARHRAEAAELHRWLRGQGQPRYGGAIGLRGGR